MLFHNFFELLHFFRKFLNVVRRGGDKTRNKIRINRKYSLRNNWDKAGFISKKRKHQFLNTWLFLSSFEWVFNLQHKISGFFFYIFVTENSVFTLWRKLVIATFKFLLSEIFSTFQCCEKWIISSIIFCENFVFLFFDINFFNIYLVKTFQ